MEWFKHPTGSHDDPDLSDAWDKFGDAGVVIFWVVLEIYGNEFNSLSECGTMDVSIKFLERKLRRRWSAVAPKLVWFQSRGRILFEVVGDRVKIRIPKFLDLASNWTKRTKKPTEAPTEAPQEQPTAKNRIEEKKKKNRREEKIKNLYSECVYLADDEYLKLVEKYGEDKTKKAIEILNNGIQSKGYKYKSHYHTLIGWPMKEAKEQGGTSKWFK